MNELKEEVEEVEKTTDELSVDDQTNDDELESKEDLEEWQKEDDGSGDSQDDDYSVNGKLHEDMKSKYKGRIGDRNAEIETLKADKQALEEKLKNKNQPEQITSLERPNEYDFNTDDEYKAALVKYDQDVAQDTYNRNQLRANQDAAQKQAREQLTTDVDSHFERAAELTEKSGIKPEIYQAADKVVRESIESVIPNGGNLVTDQMISFMGEGSEKVMFFLGRNKPAREKFLNLMRKDPSGMKAAVFLGTQKQRLNNPIKPRTQAPDPASDISGDEQGNVMAEGKYKKAYNKAKAGTQQAYDIKKKARAAGVNTSKW